MALDGHVDVVVVGFGVAGAAAALAAAHADARVLVLDQDPLIERGRGGLRPGPRALLRAGLRAEARAAGVEVRAQSRVHELLVSGGEVCGLGYAALPRGAAATGHRWLRRMGGFAPARLRPALDRAADAMWRSRFEVAEVDCTSVVLAMDSRHWEFVGPATWSAAQAGLAEAEAPALRSRWPELPSGAPTPEIEVRGWCEARQRPGSGAVQAELGVDEETGAVLIGGGVPVQGLYAAVRTCRADAADPGAHAVMTAGRRAGGSAVRTGGGRYGAMIRAVG